MPTWLFFLAQLSVLAYALVGGVFLAFSDFIMRALAGTSGAGGVEAMQVINREVFRWIFMTLFLGLAGVSLVLAVSAIGWTEGPAGTFIAVAAVVYLLGCFGVTVLFNVPMNESLGAMNPQDAQTGTYWTETYLPRWTAWNSVRAAACTVSAGLVLLGLLAAVQSSATA